MTSPSWRFHPLLLLPHRLQLHWTAEPVPTPAEWLTVRVKLFKRELEHREGPDPEFLSLEQVDSRKVPMSSRLTLSR